MSRTLPLFENLDMPPTVPAQAPPGTSAAPSAAPLSGGGTQGPDEDQRAGARHLRAARRLSRAMWRYPDHSPEQTRAGLAICRHLQALLSDADGPAGQR